MNDSKADKKRWWLSIFLEELSEGQVFQPGLLHVTVLTWFVTELPDQQVLGSFKEGFSNLHDFQLEVGRAVKFGPKKNVSANLIRYQPRLTELHRHSLAWLEDISGSWAVKDPFVGEQYAPHIRRRRGTKLTAGQQFMANYVYLIEARRMEDSQRRVAARERLK